MPELEVVGVRVELPSNAPLLLLKEKTGDRHLPIWIGAGEASAIANALEGVEPPRPLTHDLMAELLIVLGHTRFAARITGIEEGIYYAELEVDGHVVSARPSDVVALAVRQGFRITCPESLLADVGITLEPPGEDEVEKFREFLDSINPDDFEAS